MRYTTQQDNEEKQSENDNKQKEQKQTHVLQNAFINTFIVAFVAINVGFAFRADRTELAHDRMTCGLIMSLGVTVTTETVSSGTATAEFTTGQTQPQVVSEFALGAVSSTYRVSRNGLHEIVLRNKNKIRTFGCELRRIGVLNQILGVVTRNTRFLIITPANILHHARSRIEKQ
jgi:hypothetical protein